MSVCGSRKFEQTRRRILRSKKKSTKNSKKKKRSKYAPPGKCSKEWKCRVGTRKQVFTHETAVMTSGGLKKADLKLNKKSRRIVSRAASKAAKQNDNFGDKRAKPFTKESGGKKRKKRK